MFFFTPLRGFYFTFPSLYFFTIGHSGVFSLTRWSSQIHTGFHVSHATRDFPIWLCRLCNKAEQPYRCLPAYIAPFFFRKKRAEVFRLLDFHHLWCRIQLLRLEYYGFRHKPKPKTWIPTTPLLQWFRLFPFRSPLLRESLLLSFPPAT